MHEKNIAALVEYFASGCKKEQLLGLELEHFVIDRKTGLSLAYEDGVEEILKRLQPVYGEPIFSEGQIIGITRAGKAEISLEPAAQLEISIFPTPCIEKIKSTYDEFAAAISPILDDMDCELFCAGYHPRGSDLPLIPKKRYELMDAHFKKTGTMGRQMMRGTAATQISIDYEDEADFSKKFRVANILAPVFSFMCDEKMTRARIWSDVDPRRTICDCDLNFREYAKFIYEMPPIFILRDDETIYSELIRYNSLYTGDAPSSEIFAARELTPADIEHIASMAFPDVRLKNCIEIRVADSMPINETLAFAKLIKKIFYDKNVLDEIDAATRQIKKHDIAEAKTALVNHGADAEIYEKPVRYWLDATC